MNRLLHRRRLRLEELEVRRLLTVSIGNLVWNDLSGNGVQETGEPGVVGAAVELYGSTNATIGDADDVLLGRAVTDANGDCTFGGAAEAANYYEVVRAPVGYTTFTTQDAGDDAADSDVDSTGVTALFTVSAGGSDTTHDAGLRGAATGFGFALPGGQSYDRASRAVACDAAGNVCVTGHFEGTADFDPGPGTYNLTSASNQGNIFIAKYSPAGALLWARRMDGYGQDEGGAIAVAADGSVYTTGFFQGTVDFNPGRDISNLTSAGGSDIFVSKLDSGGNFVWARRLGGSIFDDGYGIVAATDGSVYVTGSFEGTANFVACNLISAGGYDVFVAKLDSAGTVLWARGMGGTSADYGYGIAVASDGSVYTTGSFQGTANFDPVGGTVSLASAGGSDIFVSKLSAAGDFVWARGIGGTSSDEANGIAVAADGSVCTTGYFQGTVDFDPGAAAINLVSAGSYDVFVSKLDSAGHYVWARRIGGSSADEGNGIAVGADGSVYTTGYSNGLVDFDPGAGTFNQTSAGYQDVFVSKLDSGGNFVWARRMGGSDFDYSNAIAVAADGSVCTTGSFSGMADFDPGSGAFYLTSVGSYNNAFVSKLCQLTVGDRVWNDLNGNGAQDAGEPGLAGVSVELYSSVDATQGNADDVFLGRVTTDADGHYVLGGLLPGVNHYLGFRAPAGYTFTGQDIGDDSSDSDVSSLGATGLFTVSIGQVDVSRDAGMVGAAPAFGFALHPASINADSGQSVATDAAGNLYVTGSFAGSADFDAGPAGGTLTIAGGSDVFVAKYSPTGAFVWARRMGGTSGEYGQGIAVAADGSVYTTGYFSGTVDFDPGGGTWNLTATGCDIFLSKLDPAGNFLWARSMGGTLYDYGRGIAVAADGSVYITGDFVGTVDFDPGPDASNLSGGGAFVAKFDSAGNFLWAHNAVSAYGYGIAATPDGGVCATGTFYGTVDFDPGPNSVTLSSVGGGADIFVWKLDAAGGFGWVRGMGGSPSDDGYGIAVAGDGSVYTTGHFALTGDFNPGPEIFNLVSAGASDVFVSKLDSAGGFLWARNMGGNDMDFGYAIACAADGGVYTTGYFNTTADFDPGVGTFNLTRAGTSASPDIFVSKLDAAGNFVWARRLGGSSSDYGYGIAAAPDGSVYTTGSFGGTADFDPSTGTFNLVSAGGTDIFLSKLLPDHAPTDVALSANVVPENQSVGTLVGNLSSTDVDAGEAFTYALVSGTGADDNGSFTINPAGQLLTAATFHSAEKSSYHIRVRTTDYSGMSCEKQLTVTVMLSGDANLDGTVNGQDLNTVLSNYNKTSMDWAHGDFNGDGAVNGADYNDVLSNYNKSVALSAADVAPPPAINQSAGEALPLFALTAPGGGAYVAGQDVGFRWTVQNMRSGSRIGLWYDEDRVWNNGNEHWIEADQIAAADGEAGYAWNTAGVPAGSYYVAGAMSDGAGACSYSYRAEPITISATGPAKGDSPMFVATKIGTVPGAEMETVPDATTGTVRTLTATRRADLLTAVLSDMASLRSNHDDAADDLIDATLPRGARRSPA
jgi:VCBS repeat-containing protein